MAEYLEIYHDIPQVGLGRGNYSGISQVYIGTPYQRGHGIGSFLGGLFRRVLPFLKSGAKAVGKEALKSGLNIAHDVLDHGVTLKEAARDRLRESGRNLKRKAQEKLDDVMRGSGYITPGLVSASQLSSGVGRVNTSPRKKRRVVKKKTKKVKRRKSPKKKVSKRKSRKNHKKLRSVADIFK